MLQDSSTMELNLPWKAKALERQTPPLGQVQFVQNTTILHSLQKKVGSDFLINLSSSSLQFLPQVRTRTISNARLYSCWSPLPNRACFLSSDQDASPDAQAPATRWIYTIWLYAEQCSLLVAKCSKIKKWNYRNCSPPTGRSSIAGVHQKRWSFIQVAQPMRMSPARGWLRHQREADNSSPPLRLLNGHGKPGNRNSLSQIYISHSAVHDWSAEEGYAVLQ